MTSYSHDEQSEIEELASILLSLEITDQEMADMRLLFQRINGIEFEMDVRNRPQGPTIKSSSTLGSKIKRALGAPESHYGMNYVGYSRGNSKWYMNDVLRAAITHANLFGNYPVEVDEEIPWEESDDDLDEEDEIADEILNDETLTQTEREQLVMARVGQGKFRSRVELTSPSCRLTGLSDSNFLVASHIKPWRVCDHKERLDGNNGLMLSPHVDQLFDEGYITFQDDGQLVVSEQLPPQVLKAWSIDVNVNASPLTKEQAVYMAYHRENVFLS